MNGQDIKWFREKNGLSRSELARFLPDTDEQEVEAWEAGQLTPHKYLDLALLEVQGRLRWAIVREEGKIGWRDDGSPADWSDDRHRAAIQAAVDELERARGEKR